ncbi:hypothetical protein GALL_525210 [mine drainage metagenome]|uniref:Uncharacterized protein n=1 Tax=mine drainage metagenome TaxID=410659 RepID=A0A1J5PQQ2_9ZZZZ
MKMDNELYLITEKREAELLTRIDTLEERLRQMKLVLMPRLLFPLDWQLNRSERDILAMLYASPNGFRSNAMLETSFEMFSGISKHAGLGTRIYNIRKKLRRFNIVIQTRNCEGYFLTRQSVEIIRMALAREVAGSDDIPNNNRAMDCRDCRRIGRGRMLLSGGRMLLSAGERIS